MAKKKQQEEEVLVDVAQSLGRAEKWFEENQKTIIVTVAAIFILVGGYFAYDTYYQEPREKEALEEIFFAQQYFELDSLNTALAGDGQHYGFEDIAANYSGTKAGNLAQYYAGISYLNLGDFENAIKYLDAFKSDDPIFSVLASGSIGDAFLELNQMSEALEYYTKAVDGKTNSTVVPVYLQRGAIIAEQEGEYKTALMMFTRLKNEFKDSPQAVDAEKNIARVESFISNS